MHCSTDALWPANYPLQIVHSALGWDIPLPAHWRIERSSRTISASPVVPPSAEMNSSGADAPGLPLPLFEFGTHAMLRGRAGKLGGPHEDQLTAGGAHILRRQSLPGLRPTMLLEAMSESSDGHPMRACLITEIIDDGTLCAYCLCREWSSDSGAARAHALRIWRAAAHSTHPIGPDQRRWIHESARLHFHFPSTWLIDEESPNLLVARHRRRLRSQPSLTLSVDSGPERPHSLTDLLNRLSTSTQRWRPARIGNRGGLCFDLRHDGPHGEPLFARHFLPEPTADAAVWALISVEPRERPYLDVVQSAFCWGVG